MTMKDQDPSKTGIQQNKLSTAQWAKRSAACATLALTLFGATGCGANGGGSVETPTETVSSSSNETESPQDLYEQKMSLLDEMDVDEFYDQPRIDQLEWVLYKLNKPENRTVVDCIDDSDTWFKDTEQLSAYSPLLISSADNTADEIKLQQLFIIGAAGAQCNPNVMGKDGHPGPGLDITAALKMLSGVFWYAGPKNGGIDSYEIPANITGTNWNDYKEMYEKALEDEAQPTAPERGPERENYFPPTPGVDRLGDPVTFIGISGITSTGDVTLYSRYVRFEGILGPDQQYHKLDIWESSNIEPYENAPEASQ